MTNENCLAGVKCPACGNEDTFRIEVITMATVTDDGAEVEHGDMEWDGNSHAECGRCLRHGKLSHFMAEARPLLAALEELVRAATYRVDRRIVDEARDALAKAKGGAQ